MEQHISPTRLLSPAQVEATWGPPFTATWLERARISGGGPRFLKTGRGRTAKIYYRAQDIEAWIADQFRTSTSDRGQGRAA